MRAITLLAAASIMAMSAAGLAVAQDTESLTADVVTESGESAGTVTFEQAEHGLIIRADLQNLPEGAHGFHIHETGSCEPDFKAAGGHYAPRKNQHGIDSADGHHAGDLPNIHVSADGTAKAEFFSFELTLAAGDAASEAPFPLADQDGSAVMVHAAADDYVSGDSAGARIACGVIAQPKG